MSSHVIKLSIENFKGIAKGELKLPKVTVLMGGNNSGKTSILEALFLLGNPSRTTPYIIDGTPANVLKVLNYMHEGPGGGYAFLLHKYTAKEAKIEAMIEGKQHNLRIYDKGLSLIFYKLLTSQRGRFYCSIDKNTGAPLGTEPVPNISWEGVSGPEDTPKSLYVHPLLRKAAWMYLRNNWYKVSSITPLVAKRLSGITRESIFNITLEPFVGDVLTLYAMTEDGERVRLSDMGEGIQVLTTTMLLYEMEKPRIVLIDNIEAHLNPRALRKLASWLLDIVLKDNVIVISSTHSLEAAKLLVSTLDEAGARVVLLDLREGELLSRELNLEDLESLEDAGVDPRLAEALLI